MQQKWQTMCKKNQGKNWMKLVMVLGQFLRTYILSDFETYYSRHFEVVNRVMWKFLEPNLRNFHAKQMQGMLKPSRLLKRMKLWLALVWELQRLEHALPHLWASTHHYVQAN